MFCIHSFLPKFDIKENKCNFVISVMLPVCSKNVKTLKISYLSGEILLKQILGGKVSWSLEM
jgi:hypothetical protein